MKNKSLSKLIINSKASIMQALKQLNKTKEKCLIVIDSNNKFLGTITDGDIRRFIIKKKNFDVNISKVYKKNAFSVIEKKFDKNKLLNFIEKKQYNIIPILNFRKQPIDYVSPKRIFNYNFRKENIPIMLMAGGEGKRMQPFTSILPKPLIPINGKPVVLHIMDFFKSYGFENINMSINYKSNILKSYLNELKNIYSIKFFEEKKPLGTAGILKKFNTLEKNFFIINCDGLFSFNIKRLVEFHEENNSDLTIVTALQDVKIPYGVCNLDKNERLITIQEKPINSYLVNTGFYICKSTILKKLPKSKKFDMDQVIEKLIKEKAKISIFPIKDWKDVGNWTNYFNTTSK